MHVLFKYLDKFLYLYPICLHFFSTLPAIDFPSAFAIIAIYFQFQYSIIYCLYFHSYCVGTQSMCFLLLTISQVKHRSLWTRAHLAFRLRTQNLVSVAKGDHFGRKILEKLQNSQNWPF